MPRKPFVINPEAIYHISSRSRDRQWFGVDKYIIWEELTRNLRFASYAHSLDILAFVLMDNHYHLMCSSPKANLSDGIQMFLKYSTADIQRLSGKENQIWGARFFRCELRSYHHILNCYKYIYQNPLRAGIVDRVEDYPFSTLRGKLGMDQHLVPTNLEEEIFKGSIDSHLAWLNRPTDKTAIESVKKGLRRRHFELPKLNQRSNPWNGMLI